MAILIGIDEAGFGPILGPLVVSSTAFSLPSDMLNADLWHLLEASVAQTRRRLTGRLLITDSKKAHSKSSGITHLERTVLSVLRVLHTCPDSLGAFIESICPESLERLKMYSWYAHLENHHLPSDDPDKVIAAGAFVKDMARNNMELLDLRSQCLDVAYYNGQVEVVRNKSSVLFSATCILMQRLFQRYPQQDLQVVVDRQGGRVHYRDSLQRMFPGVDMAILRENEALSSYELTMDGRRVRIHFVVRADSRCLPVSLASMLSKYLRELLIADLNAYFINKCKEIKPTAGYWQDGTRFINDVRAKLPDLKIDDQQFIRCR